VGNKKSSHAITEEYAKADPIFVAKTSVGLPLLCLEIRLTDWVTRDYHRHTATIVPYLAMETVDGEVCIIIFHIFT
jgi:hypothetical protein